jgi:transketolase
MGEIKNMKRHILDAAYYGQEGHIPSALSILDIIYVIYNEHISRQNKINRFVLSKGHGSLALYAALAEFGFISKNEILNFGKFNSILGGHPDRTKINGVDASTGSLGHGLPIALGMAWARKLSGQPGKIFTIIGDGEANEGTVWESALLASHHKLNNLTCILDFNHSTDRALEITPIADKFIAFGWSVFTINGHDHKEISKTLAISANCPVLIIAETIKGYGIPEMENNPGWHHTKLLEEKYLELIDLI